MPNDAKDCRAASAEVRYAPGRFQFMTQISRSG
jgi:hypothetical protein